MYHPFCPDCGNKNRKDSKFCVHCGGELEMITSPTVKFKETASQTRRIDLLKNRYRIKEEVKKGAMGCVYKGEDVEENRLVALKEMSDGFDSTKERDEAVERFRGEGEILKTLSHKSLPKIFDFFNEEERHYLVTSFIDGTDLEQLMEEGKKSPLAFERCFKWFIKLLDVLEYLHSREPAVIFRDVKPANLMIDKDDNIFLVDFGIARIFEPRKKGTIIGTPGYIAPEQYKGFSEPGSDLFSLGVTFIYLLTGSDPSEPGTSPFHFPEVSEINPKVPTAFSDLLSSLVSLEIDKRPTIDIIRKKLKEAGLTANEDPVPETVNTDNNPQEKTGLSPARIGILSTAGIVLLFLFSFAFSRISGIEPGLFLSGTSKIFILISALTLAVFLILSFSGILPIRDSDV